MTQYLVAIHLPDDFDPSAQDKLMERETKEHVGGFWILEVADMDEALAWARKAVVACRAPVEVRSFFRSDPTGLLARTR
jgi:hypothetical protein